MEHGVPRPPPGAGEPRVSLPEARSGPPSSRARRSARHAALRALAGAAGARARRVRPRGRPSSLLARNRTPSTSPHRRTSPPNVSSPYPEARQRARYSSLTFGTRHAGSEVGIRPLDPGIVHEPGGRNGAARTPSPRVSGTERHRRDRELFVQLKDTTTSAPVRTRQHFMGLARRCRPALHHSASRSTSSSLPSGSSRRSTTSTPHVGSPSRIHRAGGTGEVSGPLPTSSQ